jgi:hypothetical protein
LILKRTKKCDKGSREEREGVREGLREGGIEGGKDR